MHVLPCSLLNFLPHRNIYADKAALPCGITVRVVYKFRESSGVEGPEEILSEMLCWDSKFGRRKSAISTAWNKNHVFPVTLWRMIVGRVKTKSKTILAVSGGAREKKERNEKNIASEIEWILSYLILGKENARGDFLWYFISRGKILAGICIILQYGLLYSK